MDTLFEKGYDSYEESERWCKNMAIEEYQDFDKDTYIEDESEHPLQPENI